MVELAAGDEEGEAAGGAGEAGGDGEDGGEAFDGAEGDQIAGVRERFSAVDLYIDICQCEGADDFAEEGGFLVIGFDEGHVDLRGPEFDGDAGEAGAGAEVGGAGSGLRAPGFWRGVVGRWSLIVGKVKIL